MRVSSSPSRRALRGCLVAGVGIAATFLQPVCRAQQLYCKDQACPFPCKPPQAYYVSIPVMSTIQNETDLFASIPHAVFVFRLDEVTDNYWRWDGSTCTKWQGSLLTGTTVSDGRPTQSGNCFAVNPGDGEGFAVVVDQALQYTVLGTDGSTTFTLRAANGTTSLSGTNLVSLPFCSPLKTASDLFNDIGGKAQVMNVKRYLCASDAFESYTGRLTTGPDFPIVPGEAYFVTMVNDVTYTTKYAPCALPLCTAGQSTYNVSGTATTTTFAFRVENAKAGTICFNNCASLAIGDSSAVIASKFAAAINLACANVATATASSTTFSVVLNQISPQHLWVGTGAGDPPGCANDCSIANCDLFASGICTFNPTITFLGGAATTTPALSTWGLIGLGTLIAGIGVFLLRRGLS